MTSETKRHIDAARQVLVGVVPNPTSQIDQITNALIYKFMDDMDQAAIKQGDEPSFFVGNLERYAWTRLMDAGMGNQERMNLYSEALIKFSESKQLPELFRGIFKSAFLPYRSPETLGLFLKEIDFFDYSHPEELGNAYEYLLSIMSSQGDAGQFRTPRHIIDFIVDVVNPAENDKVLDPACGTGGFLVSSYNHILEQHDGKNDPQKKEKPLTPDQRRNLMNNFEGYDIDPTMVRIAQVNMYLHQFKSPRIFQYDSLSSDDRWNDKFDVILANPPFMSPRGGIKPHSKFSVQSSRSEVLFVDYIMNHLRPKGRAGIIVPEGIIFQSANAYKELRKKLVEDGLFAVVSLPSGVFNPYSGVKTSILLFDAELGRQQKEILFVKIENDGFDLGAQRREKKGSNLPEAAKILLAWRNDKKIKGDLVHWVSREKIAENGDYNLSGERYRVAKDNISTKWPMVELGAISEIRMGETLIKGDLTGKGRPIFSADTSDEPWAYSENTKLSFNKKTIVIGARGTIGSIKLPGLDDFTCTQTTIAITINDENNEKFIYHQLKNFDFSTIKEGVGIPMITVKSVSKIKICLPSLDVQNQIGEELDDYQRIINSAKQIIKSWNPKIDTNPEWKEVKLKEICKIASSLVDPRGVNYSNMIHVGGANIESNSGDLINLKSAKEENLISGKFLFDSTVVLYNKIRPYLKKVARPNFSGLCSADMYPLSVLPGKITRDYLYYVLLTPEFTNYAIQGSGRVGMPKVNREHLFEFVFSLPPMDVQNQIVEKIEKERIFIEGNKKLVEIYEQKIKDVISKIYA